MVSGTPAGTAVLLPGRLQPAPERLQPTPERLQPAPEHFQPAPEHFQPAPEHFQPAPERFPTARDRSNNRSRVPSGELPSTPTGALESAGRWWRNVSVPRELSLS